jgi:hypothetical protein
MEQPFILRIHWQGGPPTDAPLGVDDAVGMLEQSSAKLPTPYHPKMRQSRAAIRILVGILLGRALEESPDRVWLLSNTEGSSWAIPGRVVLAIEVRDPVLGTHSEPPQIGFIPPTRI